LLKIETTFLFISERYRKERLLLYRQSDLIKQI
jgi:hypothetical protein